MQIAKGPPHLRKQAGGAVTATGSSDMDQPKLCECGCGQPTRIARASDPRHGHVKGQGVRFLKGHSHRGKIVSPETRGKLAVANSGERNGNWKGDAVGYRQAHTYLSEHFPKASRCERCGKSGKTDYALIPDRPVSRNRADYRELCHKCHMHSDHSGERHHSKKRA